MKKTLVALAVLAASGASFAQVTITGKYGFGFKSTTTGAASANGLSTSDSNIVFKATEDLGGGMTASAQMKLDAVDRGGPLIGQDSMMSVSSKVGTFTLGRSEIALDTPDQFGTFLGATVLGGAHSNSESKHDFIKYANTFSGFGVWAQHSEGDVADISGTTGTTTQGLNTLGVSYVAGPLSVKADYSAFKNKDQVVGNLDNRTTLGGNYDFGVASVGLGFQRTAYAPSGTAMESFVGASIPLGALTVGVDYVNVKVSDKSVAADGTASGWGVQAVYSLSKRTSMRLRYANYDATMNPVDKTTDYSLVLQHTF